MFHTFYYRESNYIYHYFFKNTRQNITLFFSGRAVLAPAAHNRRRRECEQPVRHQDTTTTPAPVVRHVPYDGARLWWKPCVFHLRIHKWIRRKRCPQTRVRYMSKDSSKDSKITLTVNARTHAHIHTPAHKDMT